MSRITHRAKEKIDRVAHAIVLMERGEWQFPDGRPRWTKDADGNRVPRVVRTEAIRHVWGNVSNANYEALFSEKGRWHEHLMQRIAYHRQRLDGGYRKALAELTADGSALTVMASKVYESLWWDLNDEETCRKIPFRDRVKFFEVLTKMEAGIKGDVTTRGKDELTPHVVIQNISIPDDVKMKMLGAIEGEVEDESQSS